MDRNVLAASHYDKVTDVWRDFVMGENLHFGVFDGSLDNLPEACNNLTRMMAEAARLDRPGLEVLDVGCGIGTPSLELAKQHQVRVVGISTSAIGVRQANERARATGFADRVEFRVADALDNQLPDESFDRIWVLESSHLMPDKERLFSECARVLRPGGRLALCDIVLLGVETDRAADEAGLRALGHSRAVASRMVDAMLGISRRVWGMELPAHREAYPRAARKAGLAIDSVRDLSRETRPTLERWCMNAHLHHEAISKLVGDRYLEDFFLSCARMSAGWGSGVGYILFTAHKPS